MELPNFQHILIVRTDRIGDVILALPMIAAIHKSYPEAKISMLLREYTRDLAEGQEGLSDILIYDHAGTSKPFFKILGELRQAKIDAAIVAYPRFRIALLLWSARIPVRVGTAYRWYSFFFNRKVYEHRKTVEKHEAEYNLSLLKSIGCLTLDKAEVHLTFSEKEKQSALCVRQKLGIINNDNLILLHPGSGGSARDWKPENFSKLAVILSQRGFRVVVTGIERERSLVERVIAGTQGIAISFISSLTLREFGAFIQTAKVFIANSTGPLHIAASVGIPVIGFFPPSRVMSPKRWEPLTERKEIFVPNPALCPRCHGGECQGNDCMDQIEVNQVVDAVIRLVNG